MTNDLLTFSVTVFTGFIALMNPVVSTPVFLGLVNGETEEAKKRIAKKSMHAFFIVAFFLLVDKYIFELFEITIPAFKITG